MPLLIGLALAVFWYAVMVHRHGAGALRDFVDDQVSAKVSTSPLFLLSNPFVYLVAVNQYFPIWILALVAGGALHRDKLREFWRTNRNQCVFLLSLLVVAIVSFSFGNMRRARYLTVGYPLVACVLAGAIDSLASGTEVQRWIRRGSIGAGFLLAVGGGLIMLAGLWITAGVVISGMLLLILGVVGVWVGRWEEGLWRWLWICTVFLVAFIVHGSCFRPILSPSPLPRLTRELMALGSPTVYTLEAPSRVPGILRILSAGKLTVQTVTTNEVLASAHPPSPVATPNPELLRKAQYILKKIEADTPLSPATSIGQRARRKPFWLGLKHSTPVDGK